jgi:hypothetical protein
MLILLEGIDFSGLFLSFQKVSDLENSMTMPLSARDLVSAGSRAMAINPQCCPMSKKKDKHLEVFTCSAKTYESIPIQPSCLPFKYNGYTQLLDNPIWITCENPQVLQGCPMDRCLILPETGSELKTGSRRNTNSAWHTLPKE